jgi:hypothetical protein
MNPYDLPPQKTGMSTTSKVLLGTGIGCVVVLALCCGTFGLFIFSFVRTMENAKVDDPQQIQELSQDIVSIDLPPTLKPRIGMDVKLPFVGMPMIAGVIYSDKEGGDPDDEDLEHHNVVMYGQLGQAFSDDPNMREQLDNFKREGHGHSEDDFQVESSEVFDTTINGEPAQFTINKGRVNESDDERWQVMGSFQGKGGPAILLMHLKTADFTKEQVLAILKSMK